MPYRRTGNRIYVRRGTKWHRKQVCTTVSKAKAALRLLKSLEKKEK